MVQYINKLLKQSFFNLNEKWEEKYPIVIKSWQDNWEKLTEYFQFTSDIRRMIYTTNTIEGYHRQIRKVTKNKGVFPNDTTLEKLVYLAYRNIRKKWTMPLANWEAITQQLAIKFGDKWHYKIFCVNVKYGIQYGFRIFYLIALQNEENYEREESCSA